MSLIDIALLCKYSENHFNGMRCGIMDQFASAMGKKDHAIFLDTATLSYEYAPIKLEGKKIVIINSNKKHKLCDSKYNERREESENALKALQAAVDIESLGELNENDFEKYKESIKDSVERRRAKHAVYENQRTIQAVKALKEDDIKTFGELMVASHRSLQYDYETSCQENDIIVEETLKQKGVWGVRITGGGFGGCCVSIIDEACVDDVIREVGDAYKERTGLQASFYIEEIGDGPHKLVGNKG